MRSSTPSRSDASDDVNPSAVETAAANAERNGVSDRIEARCSDMFANVEGRFDLVVFDPPFRWFPARTVGERGTADENYAGLTIFFDEVRSYLAPEGRILLDFGTTGDSDYLHHLMQQAGFAIGELRRVEGDRDGFEVAYFTCRLS